MSGIKITLTSAFTDTSLPLLLDDPILSNGSLVLIDPTHSLSNTVGVPANNALITNIAWNQAKSLVGSGDINSLSATFTDLHQGTDALFERTSKGGLHGIYSQVNNTSAERGAFINSPTLIQSYLFANMSHRFYMSVWGRRTRTAITTGGADPRFSQINNSGSGGSYMLIQSALNGSANSFIGNTITPSRNTANVFRCSIGNTGGFTVAAPTSSTQIMANMFMWGNTPPGESVWSNKAASDVLYRVYLEDLTVSGRTYAQVDAIDAAMQATAFASGGRFYGDTFTAPSTFP